MESMGERFNKILAGENKDFKVNTQQVEYMLDTLIKDHAEGFHEVPRMLIGHIQDLGLIATVEDFKRLFYIEAHAAGIIDLVEHKTMKTVFLIRKKENDEEVLAFMLESALKDVTENSFNTKHELYEVEEVAE